MRGGETRQAGRIGNRKMIATGMQASARTGAAEPGGRTELATVLPNFLIIGAQKSGTTTLAEVLDRHPEVSLSRPKEPHYLAYGDRQNMVPYPDPVSNTRVPATTLKEYRECFVGTGGAKARGEASPSTMPVPRALGRAVALLGKPKVIAILRQPAERAYSNYMHVVSRHGEPCRTFAEAVAAEGGRISAGWGALWHYVAKGFYHRQLLPWVEAVGTGNVKVVLFEDLRSAPAALYREVFEFLEVDPDFEVGESRRSNVTRVPANRVAERVIRMFRPVARGPLAVLPEKWVRRLKVALTSRPPGIGPEIRARLTDGYREDILKLEEMIGRDLSVWLDA